MLSFFCQRVQYWDQDHSSVNIVLSWTNQTAATLYVSDNLLYGQVIRALDYQSKGPGYKYTGYLYDWLSEGAGYWALLRTQ